jgi:hypothetical protein
MKTEDAKASAIIGGVKQGKSSLVVNIIDKCYDKRSHKIVILNNSAPIAFEKYTFFNTPQVLKRNWHGVIRYHNPEGFKQTIRDVYEAASSGHLRNGAVIFDDCTKYIDANPAEDIKNFLVDRRMIGLDLIFTTHALRFLPKFCRGMINSVTIFKTAETFESEKEIKALQYPNYSAIYKAWKDIMNQPATSRHIQPHHTITTGI